MTTVRVRPWDRVTWCRLSVAVSRRFFLKPATVYMAVSRRFLLCVGLFLVGGFGLGGYFWSAFSGLGLFLVGGFGLGVILAGCFGLGVIFWLAVSEFGPLSLITGLTAAPPKTQAERRHKEEAKRAYEELSLKAREDRNSQNAGLRFVAEEKEKYRQRQT